MTNSPARTVEVSVTSLVAASQALIRAARFAEAADLLDSAATDDPPIAVARAEVAVANDWYRGTSLGGEALQTAEKLVANDPEAAWDIDFLTVRHRYGQHFHTSGKDEGTKLLRQIEAVAERAPDDRRRGWAEMYHGLIFDNILGQRDEAPAHYESARQLAEKTGDHYLTFESLRHLGDHSHDAGDQSLTREQWERSAESAARAGLVVGTLAQQLLLAQLARESGNEAGAQLLAREIARWAGAVGADRHRAAAEAFIAGQDPTKPPPTQDDDPA